MDGNGRWAKKNHFAKKKGHEAGVTNCIKICNNLSKLDCQIKELLFMYSQQKIGKEIHQKLIIYLI